MNKLKNELTGPRVFVALANQNEKIHLTGGHAKPEKNKSMCGKEIVGKMIVDARDIAPREGYQDSKLWCLACLHLLAFEALDQKILFSSVSMEKVGTYGDVVVIEHLKRPSKYKTHPFNLTPVPEKSEWRTFERD
tara:strand:- start:107 stop:511 length:405 start_codon:yes stop_codon:yes gene_type:complete